MHGGQGCFCTTQRRTFTPALLPKSFIRVSTSSRCKWPRGHTGLSSQQQDKLCKEGEPWGSWWSPERKPFPAPPPPPPEHADPAPHKESLQPSPRSHVPPELIKDEAGLVCQLAGRHTAGTGATLRWGLASWHGVATLVPPGQGARGTGLHMSLTMRLSKSSLDAFTICGCQGQHMAPGNHKPKSFMLHSSCSQAPEELYSY